MSGQTFICDAVDSGEISADGSWIKLNARRGDEVRSFYFPAEEARRTIVVLLELLREVQKQTGNDSQPRFDVRNLLTIVPKKAQHMRFLEATLETSAPDLLVAVSRHDLVSEAREALQKRQSGPGQQGKLQ